jgi:hypothetical protein
MKLEIKTTEGIKDYYSEHEGWDDLLIANKQWVSTKSLKRWLLSDKWKTKEDLINLLDGKKEPVETTRIKQRVKELKKLLR